jgi:hypothetical protein
VKTCKCNLVHAIQYIRSLLRSFAFSYLLKKFWAIFFLGAVWDQVYGFDMSCIKKQAMVEPLVDVVDANQIVTHAAHLKVQILFLSKTDFLTLKFSGVVHNRFLLFQTVNFWHVTRMTDNGYLQDEHRGCFFLSSLQTSGYSE